MKRGCKLIARSQSVWLVWDSFWSAPAERNIGCVLNKHYQTKKGISATAEIHSYSDNRGIMAPCTWTVAGCVGAGPRGSAAGGGIAGVMPEVGREGLGCPGTGEREWG